MLPCILTKMAKHFQRHQPLQESKVVCSEFQTQFHQTPGQFTKLNESIQLLNQLNHLASIVKVNHPPQRIIRPNRSIWHLQRTVWTYRRDGISSSWWCLLRAPFSNIFPSLHRFTHFLQSRFIDFFPLMWNNLWILDMIWNLRLKILRTLTAHLGW